MRAAPGIVGNPAVPQRTASLSYSTGMYHTFSSVISFIKILLSMIETDDGECKTVDARILWLVMLLNF